MAEAEIWREPVRGGYANPNILGLHGLDRMHLSVRGQWPPPPIHYLSGLRPVDASTGTCTFSMPASPWWQSPVSVFNSGVMLFVADAPLGGAIVTSLPPGKVPVTSDLSMNFLRPASVRSERLVAHASLIHAGRSLGLAEVRVEDAHGRLLGHGSTRCFLMQLIDPPPDPPEKVESFVPPTYATPDPYLREPIGAPVPQDVWDTHTGLEVSHALIAGELPAPPLYYLLGIKIVDAGEGTAVFKMPATEWLASPAAAVYGGALAMFADVALSVAVGNTIPARTAASPLDLKVNFLRPVFPDGRDLVARSRVIHRGRTMAVAQCEIYNEDEKRVVVASASVLILPDTPWMPEDTSVVVTDAAPAEVDA